MNKSKVNGRRSQRILLTSMAAIGLLLGGVGIASAATSPNPVQPPVVATVVTPSVSAPAVNEAPDANEAEDANDEVDGVDCEDGIDAKTDAECDGGPSANQTVSDD